MAVTKAFEYKARDIGGKVVKGRLEGATEGAVVSKLRAMGVAPISISEAGTGKGLQKEINLPGMKKGVGLKDLAVMSRQMATMTSSGLSLIRTLTILSEQTENATLADILTKVQADVESGLSLSDAMAKHTKHFPPLMISLVRAGESGGFLESSLESIAKNFESDVKLRATIKAALTYPVAVLIIAFLAVIGMLVFIVPVFEGMFAGFGGDLPAPTMVLVVMSENMFWAVPLMTVLIIGFALWWRVNKNNESVRKVVDPLKLKVPIFGELFKKVAIARFTRNFSTMMGAGVPILQSLSIVGSTAGNWVIED